MSQLGDGADTVEKLHLSASLGTPLPGRAGGDGKERGLGICLDCCPSDMDPDKR